MNKPIIYDEYGKPESLIQQDGKVRFRNQDKAMEFAIQKQEEGLEVTITTKSFGSIRLCKGDIWFELPTNYIVEWS